MLMEVGSFVKNLYTHNMGLKFGKLQMKIARAGSPGFIMVNTDCATQLYKIPCHTDYIIVPARSINTLFLYLSV